MGEGLGQWHLVVAKINNPFPAAHAEVQVGVTLPIIMDGSLVAPAVDVEIRITPQVQRGLL